MHQLVHLSIASKAARPRFLLNRLSVPLLLDPLDPPEDEPERLWRGATGKAAQRGADHGGCVERHASAAFRIGPSDRAEVHGDVAYIRPRGPDSLRDGAFTFDPACRRGGDRVSVDGDGGLPRRSARARGPRWRRGVEQRWVLLRKGT